MEFYKLKVKKNTKLTANANEISLDVPDNLKQVFEFKAGQYVTLDVHGTRRQYSLCSSPSDEAWSIGVKAIKGGKVSSWLVNDLNEGEHLMVSPPSGFFGVSRELSKERTILAFAAGSGITPILSITRDILKTDPKTDLFLFYTNKSPETTMFLGPLLTLQEEYPDRFQLYLCFTKFEDSQALFRGRLTTHYIQTIIKKLQANGNLEKVLICGPEAMAKRITNVATATGIPQQHVHVELFVSEDTKPKRVLSQLDIKHGENIVVDVTLDGVVRQILWDRQTPLLHALLKAGIDAPYSCSRGQCGACACKLESGEVHFKRNLILSESHIESGIILPCVATPVSASIRIDYDLL